MKAVAEPTESGGAARLVVELAPAGADAFRAAARAARAAQLQKAPARDEPAVQPAQAAPLVVIDAGHGGVDMGAVGAKSVYEKDIVLDVARRLAAKLEAGGRARTMLTRNSDEFIPLADRVKVARKNGAALFVSIHADMLSETSVHGATVYTVSDRASDAEAARVAATENAADKAGGMAESEEIGDVHDILFDLTRRETRAIGHQFATSLIDFWKAAGDLEQESGALGRIRRAQGAGRSLRAARARLHVQRPRPRQAELRAMAPDRRRPGRAGGRTLFFPAHGRRRAARRSDGAQRRAGGPLTARFSVAISAHGFHAP
ncbi:MAG: N-acetylmuramoyl-L-alanine amidase [Rhodoblastus sp.]